MTTTQTPVDAHMALVSEYAIVVMDDYARGFAPGVKQKQARAAVEASAHALAAIPAEPDALGYATRLAQAIFDKHFAHEPHYASGDVVWSPLDDLLGVLTQIDNMVAGIAQQAGGVPAGFVLGEYLHKFMGKGEGIVRRFYNGEDQSVVDAGAWIQEANQLFQVLAVSPSPSAVQPLSEAQIEKIGQTLGEQIPGVSDYTSWPGLGYVSDENGEFKVPRVPAVALQFARAIEAAHSIVTKESI